MNWQIFLASTLASFRLTRLITDDKITLFIRRWVKREARKAKPKTEEKIKEGIECPFCVSGWISLGLCAVLTFVINEPLMWLYWPAIWGGSVLWNQVFVKLSK